MQENTDEPSNVPHHEAAPVLRPWMSNVLWFVGGYNLLAGLSMVFFYHEMFKSIGVEKPTPILTTQVLGVCVGLFGIGYWLTARSPVENRHLLMLGFWSKALGSVIGLYHVAAGNLPPVFLAALFVSDIVYLPPFVVILRRVYGVAKSGRQDRP